MRQHRLELQPLPNGNASSKRCRRERTYESSTPPPKSRRSEWQSWQPKDNGYSVRRSPRPDLGSRVDTYIWQSLGPDSDAQWTIGSTVGSSRRPERTGRRPAGESANAFLPFPPTTRGCILEDQHPRQNRPSKETGRAPTCVISAEDASVVRAGECSEDAYIPLTGSGRGRSGIQQTEGQRHEVRPVVSRSPKQ